MRLRNWPEEEVKRIGVKPIAERDLVDPALLQLLFRVVVLHSGPEGGCGRCSLVRCIVYLGDPGGLRSGNDVLVVFESVACSVAGRDEEEVRARVRGQGGAKGGLGRIVPFNNGYAGGSVLRELGRVPSDEDESGGRVR